MNVKLWLEDTFCTDEYIWVSFIEFHLLVVADKCQLK